jgi:hypothetical protein
MPIIHGRDRKVYLTIFWALLVVTAVVRIAIIVFQATDIYNSSSQHLSIVNHLHIGYFVPIALNECLNAFFLLREFRAGLQSSMSFLLKSGMLYRYLIRSTEIRVSMLACIGISRAVTFSFYTLLYPAGPAGELDLYVYSLGSFFPVLLL